MKHFPENLDDAIEEIKKLRAEKGKLATKNRRLFQMVCDADNATLENKIVATVVSRMLADLQKIVNADHELGTAEICRAVERVYGISCTERTVRRWTNEYLKSAGSVLDGRARRIIKGESFPAFMLWVKEQKIDRRRR